MEGIFMGRIRKAVSIVLLLIIILFICTACNSDSVNFLTRTPDLDKQYTAEMSVQAGELEFSCAVKRFGAEFWEMSVDSPDTIAGLEIQMNSEGIKADFDGLTLDMTMDEMQDRAVFTLIFKALDNAALSKLTCTEAEEGMYFEGEAGGLLYRITFDNETLKPVLLEIPEAALVAEIKGFTPLDEMEEMEILTQTSAETN